MNRVHSSTAALVLALTTSAWAGGGPYPVQAGAEGAAGRTRQQVIDELRQAERLGLLRSTDGVLPNAQASAERGGMVAVDGAPVVLRARIRAETNEAARLGLLSFGEGSPPIATMEQEALIAAAGEHAVSQARLAPKAALAPPANAADYWIKSR